jgi:hypothetical protein
MDAVNFLINMGFVFYLFVVIFGIAAFGMGTYLGYKTFHDDDVPDKTRKNVGLALIICASVTIFSWFLGFVQAFTWVQDYRYTVWLMLLVFATSGLIIANNMYFLEDFLVPDVDTSRDRNMFIATTILAPIVFTLQFCVLYLHGHFHHAGGHLGNIFKRATSMTQLPGQTSVSSEEMMRTGDGGLAVSSNKINELVNASVTGPQ